ncbi:MAG TPA: YdcF family protein [Burkholderiaceae bacterium]|nr:YdcF family protein [Burkholderiaceae bacterium]
MTFNYALSSLLLPPTSLIAATIIGALAFKRRRAFGMTLIIGSQLLLLALSMPVVANALVRSLEPLPASIDQIKRTQAIVVLGGGRNLGAPEWGGETVNDYTLRRARYGARLARETGLPVYVSGGRPTGGQLAEGTLMRDLIAREFNSPVKWVEAASETTREQALMAAQDLKLQQISRIALVTDAVHMPRAQRAFERAGLAVNPAATGYTAQRPLAPYQLIPGPAALLHSHVALREWTSQLHHHVLEMLE